MGEPSRVHRLGAYPATQANLASYPQRDGIRVPAVLCGWEDNRRLICLASHQPCITDFRVYERMVQDTR